MLKGLFRSGWKSESVEKRLRFISDVDTSVSANQIILKKLAENDVETSVRHAAMAKITDLQILFDMCQLQESSDSNNETRQFAETSFRNLIQSASNFSETEIRAFISNNPNSNLLIAKYCPLEDLRKEILSSLNETQQVNIIADIPYSNTRIMLAESINSIESLEVARKNLKGKDKNAEKVIRSKIDSFHEKQKLELENAALVKSIREKMESLARYVNWTDEIKVNFFSLSKRWETLDFAPNEEEKALYQVAFTKVQADVKHNLAIGLSQQNQEKIVVSLEALCKKISAYSLDVLLAESTVLADQLGDLSWQLNKESETIPHTTNIHERFIRSKKAIESTIGISNSVKDLRDLESDQNENIITAKAKAVLAATSRAMSEGKQSSDWSKDFPPLVSASEAILEANQLLGASEDARKNAKEALDNLHKKINRTFGSAKRGDIGRAQRELASIVKATTHYAGIDRKKLDERIEELTLDVAKMGDWKDFAIEPKLIELCEQMERLPEQEKNSKNPSADKLASKIKTLQDTWKALGSSEISDNYWPRFKEAGDKAYEPCAVFFKQRRAIQQENLEKREPLIKQMKELLESTDWDSKPDYKSVEDNVSQMMQSWKKIKDVERVSGQKQWEKFAKIKDQINQKLDIEYEKNIAAKHALTAQFEQMLNEEVNEQTLDKLKFIQSKWKEIGVTRRKQDQTAWVKFKAASDAVYEKIQGKRQAKRAVEDEQIDAYKQIRTQIHHLAKTTQDITVSDKEFAVLEEQYKALPELPVGLPEKLIERVNSDYVKACDAYANAHKRLNKAKADAELEVLAKKAQICAELEQLPSNTDMKEVEALTEKINNIEMSNQDYIKRFDVRLKHARDENRESYTEARRLLLIECEILLGVDSPSEDKNLRLQIQLDRMAQEGIGNVVSNTANAMDEHNLVWLCLPGAEAKLQPVYDERFKSLLKQKTE